jgi:hypothetical protein
MRKGFDEFLRLCSIALLTMVAQPNDYYLKRNNAWLGDRLWLRTCDDA